MITRLAVLSRAIVSLLRDEISARVMQQYGGAPF